MNDNQDVINHHHIIFEKARLLYPKLQHHPDCVIEPLEKRAAYATGVGSFSEIHYNEKCVNHNSDYLKSIIIPHEMAHILVNAMTWHKDIPYNRRSHSALWRNLCLRLGGNGQTYVDYGIYPDYCFQKNPKTSYLYEVNGQPIYLSSLRHAKVQSNKATYLCKTNRSIITKDHFIKEILCEN